MLAEVVPEDDEIPETSRAGFLMLLFSLFEGTPCAPLRRPRVLPAAAVEDPLDPSVVPPLICYW